MVKRYDMESYTKHFYEDSVEIYRMKERDCGEYVKFEDYAVLAAQVEALKAANKKATDKCEEVAAVWRIAKIAAFNVVDDVIGGIVNQRVIDNAVILKSIIYHEDQHLAEARSKFDDLNAELAVLCTFRDEVVGVMNHSEGVWGWHKNHTIATWDELFPAVPDVESPQHHLRELRAESGRDGFIACHELDKIVPVNDESVQILADGYADKIRRGEEHAKT